MTFPEPVQAQQVGPDQRDADQPQADRPNPTPARRPRLLWVAVAVLAVLALVGGIAWAVRPQPAAGSVPAATPQQAVTGYLNALIATDPALALRYALNQPSDASLLTREVLAESQKTAPLAIVEVPEVTGSDSVQVAAKVTLGGEPSTINFSLSQTPDGWRLGQVTSTIDPGVLTAGMNPTLNGQVLAGTGHLQVFPGVYTFGEATRELDFAQPTVRVAAVGEDVRAGLQPTLTKAGIARANAIVLSSVKACMAKKEPTPQSCPNRVRVTEGQKLSTKTIKWSLVGDPWSKATYTVDVNDPTQIRGAATLRFRFRATLTQSGATYMADQTNPVNVRYLLTVTDPKAPVAWQRVA